MYQFSDRLTAITILSVLILGIHCDETCSGMRSLRISDSSCHAIMRVPLDGSGIYNAFLNASKFWYTKGGNWSINVENEEAIKDGSDDHIVYVITHTNCESYPMVTKLVINDKVLCENTPLQVKVGAGVTFVTYKAVHIGKKKEVFHGVARIGHFPKDSAESSNNVLQAPRASTDSCGFSNIPLIRGGNLVQTGEFPWLGALFLDNNTTKPVYLCTVNLVTKQHALTAAHCVHLHETTPSRYKLVFYHVDVKQWHYTYIKEITVHQNYTPGIPTHDVAVLELVTWGQSVPTPICLWQGIYPTPTDGTVSGYGPRYTQLRKIKIPIVELESCRGSHKQFHDLTSEFTFCAGNRDDQGPCLGDSGSGFMQWMGGRYYLRGLVSSSLSLNGDCNLKQYVIFVDLAMERSWLGGIIENYV